MRTKKQDEVRRLLQHPADDETNTTEPDEGGSNNVVNKGICRTN
ncbi:MAG: hypothetical protein ACXV3D_05555 [Halobacteriota archaeon]